MGQCAGAARPGDRLGVVAHRWRSGSATLEAIGGVLLGVLDAGAGIILFALVAGATQRGWAAGPDPSAELGIRVSDLRGDDEALEEAALRLEIDATVYKRIVEPERATVETDERAKAATYYGDDAGAHEKDILARVAEVLGRRLDARKAEAEALVREELRPVLDAYAAVPGLAGQHPEIFGAGPT